MARSQQTHQKREKEKQRIRQREDKADKMQERKANAQKKSLDDMLAYVDENGNLSATPPDPRMKKVFNQEDMQIGVPKQEDIAAEDLQRTGVITFFNNTKGFGFVKDAQTGESAFVHINQLSDPVKENDKVSYEVEMGFKGLNATNVKKIV